MNRSPPRCILIHLLTKQEIPNLYPCTCAHAMQPTPSENDIQLIQKQGVPCPSSQPHPPGSPAPSSLPSTPQVDPEYPGFASLFQSIFLSLFHLRPPSARTAWSGIRCPFSRSGKSYSRHR